jgi:hypothetical protein
MKFLLLGAFIISFIGMAERYAEPKASNRDQWGCEFYYWDTSWSHRCDPRVANVVAMRCTYGCDRIMVPTPDGDVLFESPGEDHVNVPLELVPWARH